MKKLAIIIPHFNGEEILRNCLASLYQSDYSEFNIYLVDNGSSDHSVEMVKTNFKNVNVIESESNLGYAGGCNLGYEKTVEPFVLFYNNDTELEPSSLSEMMKQIDSDDTIGALQPKLMSFQNKEKFDYSGACGGEMDYLGYPFARGRIFDEIEVDTNQYDKLDKNIFWASGTAILLRRSALDDIGILDHDFFAHFEEIDLCWRLHSRNWKVQVCASAIVYHYSGYTLGAMNPKKMFLNHRNNLLMIYKNLPDEYFYSIFIKRILFEFATIAMSLLKLDLKRFTAVIKSLISFFSIKSKFKQKRLNIQKNIKNSNLPFYKKSIIRVYFLNKVKKFSDI